MKPTIINDKKLGRHTTILETAQAVHDALGRLSEIESIPSAPAKHIHRLRHLLLRPANTGTCQTMCATDQCSNLASAVQVGGADSVKDQLIHGIWF